MNWAQELPGGKWHRRADHVWLLRKEDMHTTLQGHVNQPDNQVDSQVAHTILNILDLGMIDISGRMEQGDMKLQYSLQIAHL